jgi:putative redox protein
MAQISAKIGRQLYKTIITSPSGNELLADEPEEVGGQNLGFSPNELLASALAACTSATLRMYADRKQWDLQEVKITVDLNYNKEAAKTTIHRQIELIGELDAAQRDRLIAIANACPVHKILSHSIEIDTMLHS